MGMDVWGRKPSTDVGEYFRSSIWTWPSVIEAVESVGVLPPEIVDAMCYNDGAGPDEDLAIALADALEDKYGDLPPDSVFISEGERTSMGTASAGRALAGLLGTSPDNVPPSFSADVEFVLSFARFCRYSGGFEVW